MNNFLRDFDGLASNTVFCMWTGDNPMSSQRIQALWSIYNTTACPVAFINQHNLPHWIHPDYPLHPAFSFLSATHKSDYLRVYFMHHYGGGYTDIKQTTTPWPQFFDQIRHSDAFALGYQELAHGMPHLSGPLGDEIKSKHHELIGLCAFIFKRHSDLTTQWINETHALLDVKYEELKSNPSQHPQDQTGLQLYENIVSQYPLRWAELLGDIFHPLIYRFRSQLISSDINPLFINYR